jgi:hypothetical protein
VVLRSNRNNCTVKHSISRCQKIHVERWRVHASSSSGRLGPADEDGGSSSFPEFTNNSLEVPHGKQKASLQAVAGVAGFVGLAALGGIALTLAKGGPTALMAAIAKSGFSAAFALIFVSEIGDKTFFIAALLAMQYSRLLGEGTIGRISCTKSHDCHLSCNRPIVPKCTSPTSDK